MNSKPVKNPSADDRTVIIVSFNTKDITDTCLSQVFVSKQYAENRLGNTIDVIVVDNGSGDGSAERIFTHTVMRYSLVMVRGKSDKARVYKELLVRGLPI